ncbi:6054_t:CDS:2 [Entrophospora sp. SA101]|nr:6054_t:CDS:2 [Entrophospora sp. SA101]
MDGTSYRRKEAETFNKKHVQSYIRNVENLLVSPMVRTSLQSISAQAMPLNTLTQTGALSSQPG